MEPDGENMAIVLKSRGGTEGSPKETNPDYAKALRSLLARLAARNATLLRVTVDSSATRHLAEAERTLPLEGGYPINLGSRDPESLRLEIQRVQRTIGQVPGAKGGNNNKRIRLLVSVTGASVDTIAGEIG